MGHRHRADLAVIGLAVGAAILGAAAAGCTGAMGIGAAREAEEGGVYAG